MIIKIIPVNPLGPHWQHMAPGKMQPPNQLYPASFALKVQYAVQTPKSLGGNSTDRGSVTFTTTRAAETFEPVRR